MQFLLDHGAPIKGRLLMGPPLIGAFVTKNLDMLEFLLERGADPNKKLSGFSPARMATSFLGCNKFTHDVRKMPAPGCEKCGNRMALIRILALLRRYGGNPMNPSSGHGIELTDAYVDLIANLEKWEERGAQGADFLLDCTVNDPMVRGMLKFMVEGSLGIVSVDHFMGPLAGLVNLPDFAPVKESEMIHVKPEDRTTTVKHTGTIGRYMRELDEAQRSSGPV